MRLSCRRNPSIPIGRGPGSIVLQPKILLRRFKQSDLMHVNGSPVTNGMFGVLKKGLLVQTATGSMERLRLIMNLIPSNRCMETLPAGISKLAAKHSWNSFLLME